MSSEANNYYRQSEIQAHKVTENLSVAKEKYILLNELKEVLNRWDEIMGNAYPVIWSIILVIVAIVEYLFSIELYKDLLRFTPWIIPIGIIVITIFISHLFATSISKHMRDKVLYDRKRSIHEKNKTYETIENDIKKTARRNLIYAIILSVTITIFILFLSIERVNREISAAIRSKPFGFYDLLPVIFYIAEVFAGMFVLYLIKRIALGIKMWNIKKKFNKLLVKISLLTSEACRSFEKAEQLGYDTIRNTIAESLHIVFYRNKNCNLAEIEDFIKDPESEDVSVSFQISRSDKSKTLMANVHTISEYNFPASSVSNENGIVNITYKTFSNDIIRKLIVEFGDGQTLEDEVNYSVNNKVPHGILFMK